jgi:hypothetical protein
MKKMQMQFQLVHQVLVNPAPLCLMPMVREIHQQALRKLASILWAVVALLGVAVLSAPYANAMPITLLNDTFNTENRGVGQGVYSGFANFIAADVDLLAPGYFFALCQSAGGSTPCVDMQGNGNGTLTTRSAFAIAPGPVSVQFDLAGSQRGDRPKTVTVSMVSTLGVTQFSEAFTLSSTAPFATFTRTFDVTDTVNAVLRFTSSGPADSFGLLLDNVILTAGLTGPVQNPVPAPATLLLLGIGLVVLYVARRRMLYVPLGLPDAVT